jgi:hypothetical protein
VFVTEGIERGEGRADHDHNEGETDEEVMHRGLSHCSL